MKNNSNTKNITKKNNILKICIKNSVGPKTWLLLEFTLQKAVILKRLSKSYFIKYEFQVCTSLCFV